MSQIIDTGAELFRGASGAWATRQFKANGLKTESLRTLDTLRHEEWKYFDDVLINEALIRLRGVADLISQGLTKSVPNAIAKSVFAYEKVSMFGDADVSLDGISRSNQDVQEFSLSQIPLPITHKDFFINLRVLEASREKGEALDTTNAAAAARKVAEQAEKMLFQGGKTFGGLPIYGYTTHPDRNTQSFDGGKNWGDSSKAGSSFVKDVTVALAALAAKHMYGPFYIYVDAAAGVNLQNDYNAGTANAQTIQERLEAIEGISGIRVADQMVANQVVLVQMTSDVVVWVQGEPLQTIQWDEYGGMQINFKAFQIAVPLIRSDIAGRSGIYHIS